MVLNHCADAGMWLCVYVFFRDMCCSKKIENACTVRLTHDMVCDTKLRVKIYGLCHKRRQDRNLMQL